MKESPGTPPADPDEELVAVPDEELVAEDDRVIGRAFRWSIAVLVSVGVLVGAFLFWPRAEEVVPESPIVRAAPQTTARAEAPTVVFSDVTAAWGIDFVHTNGAEGRKLLPETMGSGIAIFDPDGDGDQDLLFVDSNRWPGGGGPAGSLRFFENVAAGRFRDATAERGLAASFYGTGVAVGDVDGDGDVDVFVSAVGRNHLFRNESGSFVEVTEEAGVGGDSEEWSTSAAFFDADGDGDLDLFVCNYVQWSPEIDLELDYRLTGVGRAYGPPANYAGTFPYFYINRGDGRFEDASAASGVQVVNSATGDPVAKSLGVAPVDIDDDGRIDLFVANDTVRNFLFRNLGGGRFEEVGELRGIAYGRQGEATGAMGVDSAFFRNDRELGFLVANFANEMTSLYVTQGDPQMFADESIVEGLGAPSRRMLSFGVFFFDYDLDGRLDLLQANGHLEEQIATVDPSQTYRQATQLFWNAGAAGLTEIDPATAGDLGQALVGRGAAFGDLDGDGDLDVVVTQAGDRPKIFRNDQATGNHWLRVVLRGTAANTSTDAVGAWVEAEIDGRRLRHQVMPARSYQSQVEGVVTLGLGSNDRLETILIRWPNGGVEEVEVGTVDRVLRVVQSTTP